MTGFELKNLLQKKLEEAAVENAGEEARFLTEEACGIAHGDFLFKRNEPVTDDDVMTALSFAERRIAFEPLQYILGKWEFMALEFKVGRGVLIPRPETEELAEFVIEKTKYKKTPVIFDLCSGSGCIGLSVARFVPDARVFLVEKSPEAFVYTEKNMKALGLENNVTAVSGDILDGYESFSFLPTPDVIVSNPPYIRTEEISSLQKEVQNEPFMALDGGEDGYIFYRALSEKWLPRINKGGFMAVECGEEQAGVICEMFLKNAVKTQIIKDFNNIERIVVAHCGGKD